MGDVVRTFDYPTGEEKATIEKYYPQYCTSFPLLAFT